MIIMAGFGPPGTTELIIVLVIVLVLFGPKNLPKIGGAIGRGIREFKDGISNIGEEKPPTGEKQDSTVKPMKRETPEVLTSSDEQSAKTESTATAETPEKRD
jgi:sec-independent protein translocase protein TatA